MHIEPEQFYAEEHLRTVWGFTTEALARARSDEGLRCKQIGRRRLYLGEWLLDWLRQPEENNDEHDA